MENLETRKVQCEADIILLEKELEKIKQEIKKKKKFYLGEIFTSSTAKYILIRTESDGEAKLLKIDSINYPSDIGRSYKCSVGVDIFYDVSKRRYYTKKLPTQYPVDLGKEYKGYGI